MINILIVTQPNQNGLTYHRQITPHLHLERNYNNYNIKVTTNIEECTDEYLQGFQIVSFLRLVNENEKTIDIIQRCKRAGCRVVIDIDDYWELNKTHELHDLYFKNNIPKQTIDGLINADFVTTTTEVFANEISKLNKNVVVLPNSIDPHEKQYEVHPIHSDRMRFGWIGGIYHAPDIKLLYQGLKDVYKTVDNNKFQFCLGGFNNNEVYRFFEFVFTNEYKSIKDLEYKQYLHRFIQKGSEIGENKAYKRLWAKDVYNYCSLYNELDVALVPLVENKFNGFKSQIKIIEAGWFKKPVIVSDVMPYSIDCNKNNSILIKPSKNNDGWGVAIKSLIHNPNKGIDYAESLHETIKEKYLMDKVNIVRNQLYSRLCE